MMQLVLVFRFLIEKASDVTDILHEKTGLKLDRRPHSRTPLTSPRPASCITFGFIQVQVQFGAIPDIV